MSDREWSEAGFNCSGARRRKNIFRKAVASRLLIEMPCIIAMHKAAHMCIALIPASERDFVTFFCPAVLHWRLQSKSWSVREALSWRFYPVRCTRGELKFIISMWMLIMVSFAGAWGCIQTYPNQTFSSPPHLPPSEHPPASPSSNVY